MMETGLAERMQKDPFGRPFFPTGKNVFELRLKADRQKRS